MNASNKIAQTALAGVLALSALSLTQTTMAKGQPAYEKCYGVAAAGKNDCGTATTACAATVNVGGDCEAWVYVPKGLCAKLNGSSTNKPAATCKVKSAPAA